MSMSSAAEKLATLASLGVVISRNRNPDLFDDPEYRPALALHRRIKSLSQLILEEGRKGCLKLSLDRRDGRYALAITLGHVEATYTTMLFPDELDLLVREPGLAEAFAQAGLMPV